MKCAGVSCDYLAQHLDTSVTFSYVPVTVFALLAVELKQ